MNIVVTGGAGQLGAAVLQRLAQDRKVKRIECLDIRPPMIASAKIRFTKADVRDPEFEKYLQDADVLIHLAFVVLGYLPRKQFDDINISGSKNVFEAAVKTGVSHILYSSSIAAYGVVPGHPIPIVEEAPRHYRHEMPYAAAKFKVEEYLDQFEKMHPKILVTRFRPAILVGRYMDHPFGDSLRRRKIMARSKQPMPLVWDEDVADAIILALNQKIGGAFNVTTDEPLPPKELAAAGGLKTFSLPKNVNIALAHLSVMLEKLGIGKAIDPAWAKVEDGATMIVSSEKARTELGWLPSCSTAVDLIKKFTATAPKSLDLRLKKFFRMIGLAARLRKPGANQQRTNTQIHLALDGVNGGDLGLFIQQGRLTIKNEIPRPPASTVRLSADTFIDLLAGNADFASAQFMGKINTEGEPTGGMVVNAIINGFRANLQQPGLPGILSRSVAQKLET